MLPATSAPVSADRGPAGVGAGVLDGAGAVGVVQHEGGALFGGARLRCDSVCTALTPDRIWTTYIVCRRGES